MKAILISDHAKWCALMMNGDKTVEVRTSKALATAIQKLIDENGYADIYVYCSKGKDICYKCINGGYDYDNWKILENRDNDENILNGKVVFKFRCYKVQETVNVDSEEINGLPVYRMLMCKDKNHTEYSSGKELVEGSCLSREELHKYLANKKTGYAIHISDLEIFDRPLELNKFKRWCDDNFDPWKNKCLDCKAYRCDILAGEHWCDKSRKYLTKAPQSFMFIETEELK